MGRNQCHYNCQWLGNAGLLDYTRDTEAAAESLEIGQITDLLELLGAVGNQAQLNGKSAAFYAIDAGSIPVVSINN
ncbi:hypothetical protein L915_12257 [Phytophthora nicotianae]|uniref:Uncharacterized protein n=1 Tax=Phytophthora nicotianae TaxID=4792 RepID=W2IQC5_PHYNI|nr:hypothetical protein L915_12257 [Phytophthora nicotianae]ETL35732.1 hypothetical protein L916_12177 [Phytophthora nicotianae]